MNLCRVPVARTARSRSAAPRWSLPARRRRPLREVVVGLRPEALELGGRRHARRGSRCVEELGADVYRFCPAQLSAGEARSSSRASRRATRPPAASASRSARGRRRRTCSTPGRGRGWRADPTHDPVCARPGRRAPAVGGGQAAAARSARAGVPSPSPAPSPAPASRPDHVRSGSSGSATASSSATSPSGTAARNTLCRASASAAWTPAESPPGTLRAAAEQPVGVDPGGAAGAEARLQLGGEAVGEQRAERGDREAAAHRAEELDRRRRDAEVRTPRPRSGWR